MATTIPTAPWYEQTRVYDAIRENLWIHFTQMAEFKDADARPTVIVRGEGSTIWDDQGNELLDGLAGLYSVNAGYGRQEIIDAMVAQLQQIPFVNGFAFASVPAAVLADRLGELAPLGGNARVFFTSGGSEAVESALKLAKQYQSNRGFNGRYKTISRRGAYHGTTMGALAVNGVTSIKGSFGPMVPGARHVEMSNAYRSDDDGYDAIERLVEFEGPESIAAIITEPVQNSGGCVPPASESYFHKIRKLCDETGIVMIMDEVICGFGRTGQWFGCQHFGFQPDIMTIAKGLTSGYLPLGGVMFNDRIAGVLREQGGELAHGYTYSGHPVCAAVALENLRLLQSERVLERIREDTGPYLADRWLALAEHPLVGEARIVGMVGALELVADKASRRYFDDRGRVGGLCRDLALRNGLILRATGDAMLLSPPLVIDRSQIDELVDKTRRTLDQTAAALG